MSLFKAIPGKCFELSNDLTTLNNQVFPVDGASVIAAALTGGKYTYMQITDGAACEFVRVELDSSGTSPILSQRGLEGTSATAFAKGAKVFFTWTETAVGDFIDCRNTDQNTTAPIKLPGYTATYDATTDQWCYVADDGTTTDAVEWTVGKTKYSFSNGQITTEAVAVAGLIPGTYTNATVVVGDDCTIKSVTQGDKPLYNPSVCNACKTSDLQDYVDSVTGTTT